MFDLLRPCVNCPFRKGMGEKFQLRRIDEIVRGGAFQCHKTVNYSDDGEPRQGKKPQQCAGLMALLWREGMPNQIMQVAIRLGYLDPSKLDPDNEAYLTIRKAKAAHRRK